VTAKLSSAMVPLTKLFSQEFFFRVPEYQRPFLWDAENFSDLVNDLIDAPRDRPYFLGTLVLHQRDSAEFDVVDGQQRLTALCILLACIRDAPGLASEKKIRTELHDKIVQPAKELDGIPEKNRVHVKEQGLFHVLVGEVGGTTSPLALPSRPSPSEERYELARKIFSGRLGELSTESIKAFALFLAKDCTLIYLATNSFDDAFKLFTIVNDRGKQLRRIDILKAINLDPDIIPNEHSRVKYAHAWEDMEAQLGEAQFEEIFHLLRLTYVKDKPQADLHSEFVNRVYGKKGMPQRGKEFLDELKRVVDIYDALFVDQGYLDDQSGKHSRYRTLMSAMIQYFTASEWKACLLAYVRKFERENLYDFVLKLEKVYLELWVAGTRKDERYGRYTAILRRIEEAKSPSAVLEDVEADLTGIRAACRAPNFYTIGPSKYLLVRAEILASELDHPRTFVARSVEHVLPQNPADDSTWWDDFSDSEMAELVNTAGNLVLLSKAKNSSAGRRDFTAKKSGYLTPRVSDFPRSVEVLKYPKWTPRVIRQRTKEFADGVLRDP
jgi:hypothetical protein